MKKSTISELTKEQLAESLFKFMKEKPLEKISVKEIADDCGFPRTTFYYHFEDIYDLTSWALAQTSVKSLRRGGNGYALIWDDSLHAFFNDAHENIGVLRCAINSAGLWRMTDSYCNRCVDQIYRDIMLVDGRTADPEFVRFLTMFFGHALVDVCAHWIRGDMEASPDEMVELLNLLIKDNFSNTIERFNELAAKGQGIGPAYRKLT